MQQEIFNLNVLWMLSNGSSLDENTKLDFNGNIIECQSCADILKKKGIFEKVKRMCDTKISKKIMIIYSFLSLNFY